MGGWWHGWHEILSRALREADSVCHRHTQRASSRECGGRPPSWSWGSSRLNMGVGQGVNGFLIAAVESINDSVYYWLRPKCATSSNISRSLTFHLKLSSCFDKTPKSERKLMKQSPNCYKTRSPPAIQTFFQVMKICLIWLWP